MMSVDDFKDWLKTHRETDMLLIEYIYANLDYLEKKWKQEKLDSYPYI